MAPDFSLRDGDGRTITLSGFRGRRRVILYFYPKDFTSGCTAEAGAFRDGHGALRELGADVVGVSSDSVETHRRFAERCQLPFILLSDQDGSVRRLYGIPKTLGIIPGRTTFLIDRQGVIRWIYSSQLHPGRHVREAEEALRLLGESDSSPSSDNEDAAGRVGEHSAGDAPH